MTYVDLKNRIKQIQLLYTINVFLKAKRIKVSYKNLKNYYEKISMKKQIIYKGSNITESVNILFKKRDLTLRHIPKGKLKILYITADPE
ncbi:MAG: hypothetical protein HZC52_01595 [Planctomycetes bacterium]|nr:hypothetical protein [Planctomycetota bacterium]